jgi:hypothetical protein
MGWASVGIESVKIELSTRTVRVARPTALALRESPPAVIAKIAGSEELNTRRGLGKDAPLAETATANAAVVPRVNTESPR